MAGADRPAAPVTPDPATPPLAAARTVAAFRPSADQQLTPSGPKGRARANIEAITLARAVAAAGRPATPAELDTLAAWSSWGAVPQIFEADRPEWAPEHEQLRNLLTERQWNQAMRTTRNAHYTDPGIVAAIWSAVQQLGGAQGRVLEPGCGSGTFIGMAPDTVERVTGVEVDEVTAGIAASLYPHADVRPESFADSRFPDGTFDAAVGNVPFADTVLHDRLHNPNRHSMHNHFIVKSLDLVRPGGLVAVLTSRFTLDATNPAARLDMFDRADLIGAVRLPTGAHRRTAGTEAVTDLLILRRREPGRPAGDDTWLRTTPLRIGGELRTDVRINRYFREHPDHVLGEVSVEHGMHNAQTLTVRAGDLAGTPHALTVALDGIVQTAVAAGLSATGRAETNQRPAVVAEGIQPGLWLGMVVGDARSGFQVQTDAGLQPLEVKPAHLRELGELLTLRDLGQDLIDREAAAGHDDDPDMEQVRTRLRDRYEAYVARYGPINRVTLSETGKPDPETGERPIARRYPGPIGYLRRDPFRALVRALERYDEETQRALPAEILNNRVVAPRTQRRGADTAEDALAIALDTSGRLDLGEVADLLGVEPDAARAMLGDLVFDEPDTGRLIPAAEYLSGNVRTKLDAAQAALDAGDERYRSNVEQLTAVLPEPLGPQDITPKVGAAWISVADHRDFLRELLGDRNALVQTFDGGATWGVRALRGGVKATSQWGTDRRPAPKLFELMLNQQQILVQDHPKGEPSVTNGQETEAAKAKAEAIAERFVEWVWENPERAQRLADTYNRQFNSLVLRNYDGEGDRLTLPGLVKSWTPRPHQRAAVARMLSEPAVLLAHEVGAGKTGEMVMGAMELKRLGLARKPVVVVPNHMLDQVTRDWQQMYPRARLLSAGADDVSSKNGLGETRRRELVARIATGDWDGIIITHGAFERIPVSKDFAVRYLEDQVSVARTGLEVAQGTREKLTVKTLERKIQDQEEKIKKRLDGPNDAGLTFESTGIDYVIVDEAHLFKNLATTSSISGASIDGANRSQDLHMKLELLRSRHGERVGTFATATPIANSISEAHVMTRYLRPDLLDAAGVTVFDRWAATFGETVTQLEPTASGGSFKFKTRFARFQNVPELLHIWSMFADVKTAGDLNLPRPNIRVRDDGERMPVTTVLPLGPELAEFIDELDDRLKQVSGWSNEPGADNALKIIGEGRHAALDMRLVGRGASVGPTKVTAAADKIATIWRANADNQYFDDTGQTSPTRGALQMVFCDLSTPKAHKFNIYNELKSLLIERGMPARSIRFIHEADTVAKKARLFAACRSGDVSALIGSTSKMGVGMNVQDRAIALHHLDAPWRPADVQQRDGRVWRQGNQNPEIEIHRWTTEKSFDTFMWQTLARKQTFIEQVLRGRLDVREIDDVGPIRFGYAETTSVTAGDPLIIDKANADRDLSKYRRLERAWQQEHRNLDFRITTLQAAIAGCDRDEPGIRAAVQQSVPTAGDQFRMSITRRTGGTPETFTDRVEAQHALRDVLMARADTFKTYTDRPFGVTIDCGGHIFTARQTLSEPGIPHFALEIANVPGRQAVAFTAESFSGGHNVIRMIENTVTRLADALTALRAERDAHTGELETARDNLGAPFKHAQQLADATAEVQRIDAQFAARVAEDPDTTPSAGETATPTTHPPGVNNRSRSTTGPTVIVNMGERPNPIPMPDTRSTTPPDKTEEPASTSVSLPAESHPAAAATGNRGPIIHHGVAGTTVTGTDKSDTMVRQALKDCGFKWSSNHNMWYLPRRMSEHNRMIRINRIAGVLKFEGRAMLPIVAAASEPRQTSLGFGRSDGSSAMDHDLGETQASITGFDR